MDETLIELGVFLVGAGVGAALIYLKDRRMLHFYGDRVRQLSGALQEQVDHAPASQTVAQTRLLREPAEQVPQKSAS